MTTKQPILHAIVATIPLLVGCTGFSDGAGAGGAPVELVPSERIALGKPAIVETDAGVTITGRVSRIGTVGGPARGHVHVELVDASGKVIQSARDEWFPPIPPLRVGRSRPSAASYAVTFPTPLPAEGKVRVIVGTDSHQN